MIDVVCSLAAQAMIWIAHYLASDSDISGRISNTTVRFASKASLTIQLGWQTAW